MGEEGTEQWRLTDEIRGYMVGMTFSNSILNGSPRKKAFEKVKKQTTLLQQHISLYKSESPDCLANVLHSDGGHFERWESRGGSSKKIECTCHPEAYQLLMVTSNLLMSIFDEKCMKNLLRNKMKERQKDYENAFGGNLYDAMKKVPILENETCALPGLGRIPVEKF